MADHLTPAELMARIRAALEKRDTTPISPRELAIWLDTLMNADAMLRELPLRQMVLAGERMGQRSPSFKITQAFFDLQVSLDQIFLELAAENIEGPAMPTHNAPARTQ
jgi:hypothetical protein